ncbi:hypothetical protein P43SY_011021 [Pythium insidiosum]|uniref:Uncharacterized protein n=1 Tax=Pythium insidiosum TaxID=114742 RepID=A0AAD5Q1F8_PYTIN|nr:hypothetical protein P43SY_011021 [Pythium insidiosum]
MELAGDKTQADIAARIGVLQSTVSRHIRRPDNNRTPGARCGRKSSLTQAMLSAAARFPFLFATRNLLDTAAFLFFVYGVRVSTKTIARHLKDQCGFRTGDFRRYPQDRNGQRAIDKRYEYARSVPAKYGQNALYHAIYYDEMKLSRVTKSKAWSICGWIPTVEGEFDNDTADHITLLLAACPAFGLVHVEIVEGSVTGETVLDFLKSMMTEYLARDTVETGHESKAFIKKALSEEVLKITAEDVRSFYFHVEHFLKFALERAPVPR